MPTTKITGQQPETQQPTERERNIASLRAFADWLEANPDVPLRYLPPFQYSLLLDGSDAERVAEAHRVAELVGAEVKLDGNRIGFRHLTESGIEYVVHGFTELGDAKYNEEQAALSAFRKAREEKAAEAAADKPWFDADEPRVWRCTVQADRAEPVGAPTVVDGDGDIWTVVDPDALVCVWTSEGREPEPLQWERLLDLCGELTEVVPPAQDGAR